jgi:5-methyltetrahydropteroyltriglutamate--homocysteine methyltransferase
MDLAASVHEHESQVWEDVAQPDGKLLMPGMVGHCTDLIEHPDLVAHRIVRMAHGAWRRSSGGRT